MRYGRNDASYPSWIVPKDTVKIIYLTPVRTAIFYMSFSMEY